MDEFFLQVGSLPCDILDFDRKAAIRVVFALKGDREKALGIAVSPDMDRDNQNIPAAQAGFIDFMCMPLFKQLAEAMADHLGAFVRAYTHVTFYARDSSKCANLCLVWFQVKGGSESPRGYAQMQKPMNWYRD